MNPFEYMISVLENPKRVYGLTDKEVTQKTCGYVENVLLEGYKIERTNP